jgi:succinyl-CoA synthetase beta subunit
MRLTEHETAALLGSCGIAVSPKGESPSGFTLSAAVNPVQASFVLTVESEEEAVSRRADISVTSDLGAAQALELFGGEIGPAGAAVVLSRLCRAYDVEHLIVAGLKAEQGMLSARSGVITVDDRALVRQPRFFLNKEPYEGYREYQAALSGFRYIPGTDEGIAVVSFGADAAAAARYYIACEGETTAWTLVVGGENGEKITEALSLCFSWPCKAVLAAVSAVHISCDETAGYILEAMNRASLPPAVFWLRGVGEKGAQALVEQAGYSVRTGLEEAAVCAVDLALGGGLR